MINKILLESKIRAVLFGQACGDALGLATEFMPKREISKAYPNGILHYRDIQVDEHTERWEKGEWTDDTDQMLCIMDAILLEEELTATGVAQQLLNWLENGARGIGNTVYDVLTDQNFLSQPHEVAKNVWEKSGQNSAANGAVMRTSVLGVWEYYDLDKVAQNAKDICQITHYDPRCVASCIVVCIIIAEYLNGKTDQATMLDTAISYASSFDPDIESLLCNLPNDIAQLHLDESKSIGYTYKALSAAIWAWQYTSSFQSGILKVIHEGGDADTNAAVAGALLGAKYGFRGIPLSWTKDLVGRQQLEDKTTKFIRLINQRVTL